MPYHHGNLREALIEAGVELARTAGPEAATLRAVSREVGVSHNAAYRHFADHEALQRALAARALTIWATAIAEAVAAAARGRSKRAAWDRLEACGRAYVDFATREPGLFALACSAPLGEVQPDGDVPHGYTQLSERLDELVAVGAITPRRRRNAEIAAWAGVHGYASLVNDGLLGKAPPEVQEAGFEEIVRVIRDGLGGA